jgi:Protein of unknown function (DUF 659)
MEDEGIIQDEFKKAPSAQRSMIWKYYLISTSKKSTTHRHLANCCYCNVVMDGKVQRMQKHTLNCMKVGNEEKAHLYRHIRDLPTLGVPQDDNNKVDDDESLSMNSSHSSSADKSYSSSTTLNKHQTGIQSYYGPVKLSQQMENDYALSLLRAIIVGNVSVNFIDSFYFEEFIRKIKPNWIVPSPTTFMDKYLVQLFATALENRDLKLKEQEVMTLLLDGWTDVSSNSIYGLILLFGDSESEVLEILDLSSERHTAENLLLDVSNIVNSSCINWAQIKCCCTDSPNTMIKFRHLLNKKHKHIIVLPCALHALNLLAKDLCKFADAVPIVKSNCMIINFYMSSHIWFHNSKEWVRKNSASGKYRCSLDSLCET